MNFNIITETISVRSHRMVRIGTGRSLRKIRKTIRVVPKRALNYLDQWRIEPIQDLQAEYSLDLIEELTKAIYSSLNIPVEVLNE